MHHQSLSSSINEMSFDCLYATISSYHPARLIWYSQIISIVLEVIEVCHRLPDHLGYFRELGVPARIPPLSIPVFCGNRPATPFSFLRGIQNFQSPTTCSKSLVLCYQLIPLVIGIIFSPPSSAGFFPSFFSSSPPGTTRRQVAQSGLTIQQQQY